MLSSTFSKIMYFYRALLTAILFVDTDGESEGTSAIICRYV